MQRCNDIVFFPDGAPEALQQVLTLCLLHVLPCIQLLSLLQGSQSGSGLGSRFSAPNG